MTSCRGARETTEVQGIEKGYGVGAIEQNDGEECMEDWPGAMKIAEARPNRVEKRQKTLHLLLI